MGKVVLFLPIAVSLVMLPQVSERRGQGRDTRSLLRVSLTYTAVLSSAVALAYWLVPEPLVRVFFGAEYAEAAPLIGWYGTAMALFAANYLFAQYNIAVSNRRGLLMAMAITLIQVITIASVHSSLQQVVLVLLFGNLLLAILSLIPTIQRLEWARRTTQNDNE
jgi:O-antigen/teichoic acid export membrane protein